MSAFLAKKLHAGANHAQWRVVHKVDAENLELYLLGDLNCDLLPDSVNANSSHLLNIMDICGLTQLITEPTRVTQYSRTLTDLCLTNSPDKICNSGVVNIGISDHCHFSDTQNFTFSLFCS